MQRELHDADRKQAHTADTDRCAEQRTRPCLVVQLIALLLVERHTCLVVQAPGVEKERAACDDTNDANSGQGEAEVVIVPGCRAMLVASPASLGTRGFRGTR